MSSLDKDEDRRPLGVVQSFIVTQKTSKKELCKLCSLRRQLWHVFTILPSHRGRFTMSPSTSNQKGIFCSSSFLMSIFCEKSGYFTLPGGVCTCAYACVCVCVCEWEHMSDEVFGNRRAGLIITDISLDAFRPGSSWERSVMPPDPKVKEKRWEREKVRRNDEERQRRRMKKAHKMKKKGGKVWDDICLASFHLACSLTNHSPSPLVFHKVGGKMTSLIWQRQTSKPHNPPTSRHPCLTLLHFSEALCVCVRVCVIFWGVYFFHRPLVSHRETLRWTQCLCQVSTHWEILRRLTLSSWLALVVCVSVCVLERESECVSIG